MADILMVIAPEEFRDEEYFFVREELEKAGHNVNVASTQDVALSAVDNKEVVVDLLIDECDVADYDALVFSGGAGAKMYFEDEKVLEMCYQTVEQGKILAAICIAPGILARAGVLEGKNATSWGSEKVNLDESGAITSDSHVVVDGQIITADGPQVSREFGKKIAEELGSLKKTEQAISKENELNEEYYPPEKGENIESKQNDEGFPENKPYYEEHEKNHEKRIKEEEISDENPSERNSQED